MKLKTTRTITIKNMKKILLMTILFFCVFAGDAQQATNLTLMPLPKQVVLNAGKNQISNKFTVSVQGNPADTVLYKAVNRAHQALNRKTGLIFGQQYISLTDRADSASLRVIVKTITGAGIGVDESYSLRV